jgi:hypothetical protein
MYERCRTRGRYEKYIQNLIGIPEKRTPLEELDTDGWMILK